MATLATESVADPALDQKCDMLASSKKRENLVMNGAGMVADEVCPGIGDVMGTEGSFAGLDDCVEGTMAGDTNVDSG